MEDKYGPGLAIYKSEVDPEMFATVDAIQAHGQLGLFLNPDGSLRFHPYKREGSAEEDVVISEELGWLKETLGYDDSQLKDLKFMFAFMWEAKQFMER